MHVVIHCIAYMLSQMQLSEKTKGPRDRTLWPSPTKPRVLFFALLLHQDGFCSVRSDPLFSKSSQIRG